MFLLVFLIIALVVAVLMKRDFSGAEGIRLRAPWLFPVSLLIQVAVFNQGDMGRILEPYRQGLHILSYLVLVAGMVPNLGVRGFVPMLAGGLSNLFAISLHKGYMPTTMTVARAISAEGFYIPQPDGTLTWNNSVILPRGHCPFDRLGDVFSLPSWFPMQNVFSVGDVLIGAGMVMFVWALSAGSGEKVSGGHGVSSADDVR